MENKKVLSKKQLGLIALKLLNHRINRYETPKVPQILKLEWRSGVCDGEFTMWINSRYLEYFFEVGSVAYGTAIFYDHKAPQTYTELTGKKQPEGTYASDRYLYVGMI